MLDTLSAKRQVVAVYYWVHEEGRPRRVKITVGQSDHEYKVSAGGLFTSIKGKINDVFDEVNKVKSSFLKFGREFDKMGEFD